MKNWICPQEYAHTEIVNIFHKEILKSTARAEGMNTIHFLARREFDLDSVAPSTLYITADDYYKLYVNGVFVTQGPATAYPMYQNVNAVDLTGYLRKGRNVIAVHCFYSGYLIRAAVSGDGRIGLCARLVSDGKELLTTDESWKIAFDRSFLVTGEMCGYNTQAVEHRDMNLYPHGWTDVFFDDSGWADAALRTDDDHEGHLQLAPGVESAVVTAESVRFFAPDHFLLDFGRELVGCVMIDACGRKDSSLRLLCGEELTDDGHVLSPMRCGCLYDERITLSGKRDLIENYEYKGFRYVEIIAGDTGVTPGCVSVRRRNYPVVNPVSFRSSESALEDIWEICRNAVVISAQEGFLDCPTREKGQYLGDMVITGLSHAYLTGDVRLYRKALYDFAHSDFICPGLLSICPSGNMGETADYSLLYPRLLYNYYQLTGDQETLEDLAPKAEACVGFFGKFLDETSLLRDVKEKKNLMDWPANLRDGYDFQLKPVGDGCHNVLNAHYYGAMDMVNRLRALRALPPKYELEPFRRAYMKAFFREDQNLFADTTVSDHASFHSNAIALCHGLVDQPLADSLTEYIMSRGFQCGVYFAYFVLCGLARYGKFDEIYRLIMSDGVHSWKNMLREGATSVYEAWGRDQKWNTSLCHPWASAPVIAITEYLLGFRFEEGVLYRGPVRLPDGVTAELTGGFTESGRFIR